MAHSASIKENAFKLCVWLSTQPQWNEVNQCLQDISKSSEPSEPNQPSKSHLAYIAKKEVKFQFAGFIISNAQINNINEHPLSIKAAPLSETELRHIESAHEWIEQINYKCAEALNSVWPEAFESVLPYQGIDIPRQNTATDINLESDEISNLVQSFHSHPALSKLEEAIKRFKPTVQQGEMKDLLKQLVWVIYEKIEKQPDETINDLSEMKRRTNLSAHELLLRDYIQALIAFHSSLVNLDQLLFQKFLSKKLPVYHEENVFDLPSFGSDFFRQKVSLSAFPDTNEILHSDPGCLALLKLDLGEKQFDDLAFITKFSLHFNQESGTTQDLELLLLDDHLNSYSGLLS